MKTIVSITKKFIFSFLLFFSFNSIASLTEDLPTQPLNIPKTQFANTLLPFGISKDFATSTYKIPKCDPHTEPVYDRGYFIGWSGLNNKEYYVKSVNEGAKAFAAGGMEVHTFMPTEDARFYGSKFAVARGDNSLGFSHDTTAEGFKELIDDIKKKNKGKKVLINIMLSNHGVLNSEKSRNSFEVVGPARTSADGKRYNQNLSPDLMAYAAQQLKEFDVRFINGSCYGSNQDDYFQQAYIKARAEAGLPDVACSCSSALAEWGRESTTSSKEGWEAQHFKNPWKSSFLQASFNALSDTRLGWEEKPNSYDEEYGFRNAGMTTSERLLYLGHMARSQKFLAVTNGINENKYSFVPKKSTDELLKSAFDLNAPETNLRIPSDPKYKDLYQKSKIQTQEFLKSLELTPTVKRFLGLNDEFEINFEHIKKVLSLSRKGEAYGKGGKISDKTFIESLGSMNMKITDISLMMNRLQVSMYELDKQLQEDPAKNTIQVFDVAKNTLVRMNAEQLRTAYETAQSEFNKVLDSEYHNAQTALVLIKRLALMLDFLNNQNISQREKDLFAFYRGCELQPLMPQIKDVARDPNNLADAKPAGSNPLGNRNGTTHNKAIETKLKN